LSSTYCGQALIESHGLAVGFAEVGIGKVEEIGDETFLVDAVGAAGLIGRGDQAAVFRGPFHRVGTGGAVALHAAGKDPKIGARVVVPIHRPSGDDEAVVADIKDAGAGVCRMD
jgi:hypothetical protein